MTDDELELLVVKLSRQCLDAWSRLETIRSVATSTRDVETLEWLDDIAGELDEVAELLVEWRRAGGAP